MTHVAQASPANQVRSLAAAGVTGSSSADTQPPTTPTGLTTSFSCDSTQGIVFTLRWTASTDNVGVSGYDVYASQGTSSGPFSLVTTTSSTSYTQRVTVARFEVRARDAAGSTSEFTAPVLIIPPPSPCVTQSPSASTSVSPPPSCTARYGVGASWPGGFQGQVTVTNAGTDSTRSWTVTLTFAEGQTINQVWGASTTSTASPYTFSNLAYNATLAPGASTTFGFIGSSGGANTAPAVTCTRTP